MRAITKKAIKDVTRRKLRATLTIVGIAIGILGLSAISITSSQINASLSYITNHTAQPDISFTTTPAPASLAGFLATQPNVKRVQAGSLEVARWAIPSGHYPLAFTGISDFQDVQINPFQLISGHLPGAGEVLMESSDQSIQSLHVGDIITVSIRNALVRLTVSGFARTQGQLSASSLGLAFGYMPESALESLYHFSGPTSFLVQVQNQSQAQATARQLTQVIEGQQVRVLDATVGQSGIDVTGQINGLLSVLGILAAIALLLSVFLLLSTMTTLIAEQVPVIGTMKAIGARRWQVMRNYLTSVVIYGVAGTLVGLALGILVAALLIRYLNNVLTLDANPFGVTLSTVILSLAVGVGVPLLAALFPIWRGTRITVHQALSGYGLDGNTGGRGLVGRLFGFLPQTTQLGMRSLARKRSRTALTLLALALSGACFLAVQTTAYSFSTFLDQETHIYHADIFVNLANPTPREELQQALANTPGIAELDGTESQLVHSQWGDGVLTGIAPGSPTYHQQMLSGRWFTANDTNVVVLSDKAATNAGKHIGDTISFNDGLHNATLTVIGIARDNNNAGIKLGVLLAPLAQVNAFRHLPASYLNTALIIASDQSAGAVTALAARVDDALSAAGVQAVVETLAQIIAQNQSTFLIVEVLLYLVAVIVAVVGAIGLFNALAMSVLERRREIGILRSMGARSRQVAQVFWTEGITLGAVSWVLAIALGIPAAYGFVLVLGKLLATLPFALNPLSLIWMLLFILVVATLASVGPVFGASRLRIAETLKYE